MDTRVKILPFERAPAELLPLGTRGSVAVAAGHFEILHAEHCRRLEALKGASRTLVVFVYSDRAGKRALLDASARAQMVAALACVDRVVICDEADADSLASHCNLPSVQRVELAFPRDIVADVLERYPTG